MKNIGFFGDLVAYPIEGEKYRIESGHRRYDAAMLADITEVPVFKLNPKMQSLAESGNYSWAILSQASQLNDFQQNMLYRKITMQGSSEELTTKVASFQQRTKPLWIGLRPSLSDFLLHLPGALPFGRVLPRLSDMHPCDASPTAVQAL